MECPARGVTHVNTDSSYTHSLTLTTASEYHCSTSSTTIAWAPCTGHACTSRSHLPWLPIQHLPGRGLWSLARAHSTPPPACAQYTAPLAVRHSSHQLIDGGPLYPPTAVLWAQGRLGRLQYGNEKKLPPPVTCDPMWIAETVIKLISQEGSHSAGPLDCHMRGTLVSLNLI